jgi:hypothetical protein
LRTIAPSYPNDAVVLEQPATGLLNSLNYAKDDRRHMYGNALTLPRISSD